MSSVSGYGKLDCSDAALSNPSYGHHSQSLCNPIPRKRKFQESKERVVPGVISDETKAIMAAKKALTAAWKTIKKIQSIHACSDAKSHGVAYLFIELEGAKLGRIILNKRCISSRDCIPSKAYIDNTNLSKVITRQTCPMIAYSITYGMTWYRGYLLNPGPTRVEIVRVHGKDIFDKKIKTYFPMGRHKDQLRIRYINAVDETMDSQVDGALVSRSSGPDTIDIRSLSQNAREVKLKGLENIINIPPRVNLKKRVVPNPFSDRTHGKQTTKETHLVKNVRYVTRASNDRSLKDRKSHFAFISPDEKGTLFFLEPDDAKKVIRVGSWGRKDFLNEIKSKAKYTIDCEMVSVPDDGISLAERYGDEHVEDITQGIESFKLRCNTFAQYSVQEKLDINVDKFSFIVNAVRRGESFKRKCMKSLGLSVIKKVNCSGRPHPNPRKDIASIKRSQLWVEKMDPTFAPLLDYHIELLARYSSSITSAFDTVIARAYRQVYMDTASGRQEKLAAQNNNDPSMGLFDLQILTFPKGGINYANSEHIDVYDGNNQVFNRMMDHNLEKYLKIWLKKLSSAQHEQEKMISKKNIRAILHLIRKGTGGESYLDSQLKYSTDTTCAYQVMYTGEKNRETLVTFAYPGNATVVEFVPGRLIFQSWSSYETSHMTPVALTFDSDNVYLNDEHLIVLAWGGGGTSKISDFLGDHNLPNDESGFTIRRMCEVMRDNNADDEVVQMATTTFPHYQTFITNFFNVV